MILADTSVWVAHFKGMPVADRVPALLDDDALVCHPWIVGELALGGLSRDDRALLDALEWLPEVASAELLVFLDQYAFTGIGWVDVQLLAAARLSGAAVWTTDARLHAAATRLGLGG